MEESKFKAGDKVLVRGDFRGDFDGKIVGVNGSNITILNSKTNSKIVVRDEFVFKDLGSEDIGRDVPAGLKNDFADNKLRYDLFPLEEMDEVVKLYTFGCKKYKENSWKEVEDGEARYRGAMLRHLTQHLRGEEMDSESDCSHLSAVVWNAIAMYWHWRHSKRGNTLNGALKDTLNEIRNEEEWTTSGVAMQPDGYDARLESDPAIKNIREDLNKRLEERLNG